MKNNSHEWIAVFTLHLTGKEAAQAYTFDHHGKQVVAKKLQEGDGEVMVGCYRCEQPYTEALGKPCIESSFIKDYEEHKHNG